MKTRFVRDEAATNDFFGGHGRIADTLVDLIDHPDRPRLVGLLGTWGSGKSTVLKLAEKRLTAQKRKPETIVFTFDAWMHQSDPPRRAFIEAFIEFLKREEICPGETWAKELSDIQRRNETHEIESTPVLSPWGIWIALSLLALPLGVRLSGQQGILGWIGWILFALPFSIAAINWWWWRPDRNITDITWFFRKENLSVNRAPYEKRSITSVFVSKTTDKTINRILKSPEPTSIEFRQSFADILEKIASRKAKFVFVLDNLDRVSSEDALIIWSTFRSLFASAGSVADRSGLQFSVVIPLDYHSLKRLYSDTEETDPVASRERIQSLVDKSFDVVLRVGPPVRSDWGNYLHDKLNYAFYKNINPRQIYEAATIFQTSLEVLARTTRVTPRDVNSYVNSVSILWSQRGSEVSFSSICYYACFSAQGDEFDIASILQPDAPAGSVMSRLDRDWRSGVSAIHFGVPVERALQILVGDQIVAAVTDGDRAQFEKLEHIPGFAGVLEQLLRSDQPRPPSFYATLAALLPADIDANVIGEEIWDVVLGVDIPVDGWDKLSELTAEGLGRIAQRGSSGTTARLIISLSRDDQSFEEGTEIWLKNVSAVVSSAPAKTDDLAKLFVPFNSEYYLIALAQAEAMAFPEHAFPHLRPRAKSEDVVAEISNNLRSTEFSSEALSAIGRLLRIGRVWPWADLCNAAGATVLDPPSYSAIDGALRALLILGTAGNPKISELGTSGHLANTFYDAWTNSQYEVVGTVVASIAVAWPDLSISEHYENSSEGLELLTSLDDLDEEDADRFSSAIKLALNLDPPHTLRGLLTWAQHYGSSRGLIYRTVRQAIESGIVKRAYLNDIAKSVPYILGTGNSDGGAIVAWAARFDGFWTAAIEYLSLHDLAKAVAVIGAGKLNDATVKGISDRIATQDQAFWENALQHERAVLTMVDQLLADGHSVKIGGGLRRAYNGHLAEIASGADPVDYAVSWPRLMEAAEPDDGDDMVGDLLDLLARVDNASRLRIFLVLGDEFLSAPTVVAIGDRLANVLMLPLLVDDDEQFPKAVVERAEALAPLAKKFKKSTRTELKAKIERLAAKGIVSVDLGQKLEILWRLSAPRPSSPPRAPRPPKAPSKRQRGKKPPPSSA